MYDIKRLITKSDFKSSVTKSDFKRSIKKSHLKRSVTVSDFKMSITISDYKRSITVSDYKRSITVVDSTVQLRNLTTNANFILFNFVYKTFSNPSFMCCILIMFSNKNVFSYLYDILFLPRPGHNDTLHPRARLLIGRFVG